MNAKGDTTKLGEFVREQRTRRGLSGQALAAAAGVDKGHLHRLEHGEIESPDPRVLVRLARALEVEVNDLYVLAGYVPGSGLPSVSPYLRAKYRHLPDHAVRQIEEYIDMLNERYGGEKGDDDGIGSERAA